MYINELNIRHCRYKCTLYYMVYIFILTEMDGLRLLGKTTMKINDYDISTPTISEGTGYKCCEMKMAAFVCLGSVMAVILAIVFVWFIRRKRKTKQYTLTKLTPKSSGSLTQRYTFVQQCVLEVDVHNTCRK